MTGMERTSESEAAIALRLRLRLREGYSMDGMDAKHTYLPKPLWQDDGGLSPPRENEGSETETVRPPSAALVLFPRPNEADVPRPGSRIYHGTVEWNVQRPSRSQSPRARLRAFMRRPQAPLGMNPPTRPGTAGSAVTRTSSIWTRRSGLPDHRDTLAMSVLPGLRGQYVARSKSIRSQDSVPSSRLRVLREIPVRSLTPTQEMPSNHRPVVYGTGKYADLEVTPQPSEDADDPLNWPTWKKEVNFGALLLMVAFSGVLKTIFLSVNSLAAVHYNVSYTAVAALTGVPLMLSAFTGLLGLAISRCCGKRPVYLAGLLLVFVGTVWNTWAGRSYGQCMTARIFQGLGWGVFDGLVVASIGDTYFEHERGLRLAIYLVVAVAMTWGPPLVGGVVSQTAAGFTQQFRVLSAFFVLAVPAVALGMPETCFDRTSLPSAQKSDATCAEKVTVLAYLASMKPRLHRSDDRDAADFSETLLALVAPTTLLASAVATLPFVALWGLTSSLALLSTSTAAPKDIGTMLTGPWLFATITVATFALYPPWGARFAPLMHVAAMAGGTALVFIGLLATGLAVHTPAVKFASLSALLGLLAAGGYVLDATTRPLIDASVQSTCSDSTAMLRAAIDMDAAAVSWRALVAGMAAMAVPGSVASTDDLKGWCVGAAVAQIIVAVLVGAVWWFWPDKMHRVDGRVMQLKRWSPDKQPSRASFFDTE